MKLVTQSGLIINMKDYGVTCLTPHISSPAMTHETETADGRDGSILLGSVYQARDITLDCLLQSMDRKHLDELRVTLYRIFSKKEPIFLILDREPTKRWKVLLNSAFEIERVNAITGQFKLNFLAFSPFAESIGTTLHPATGEDYYIPIGQGEHKIDEGDPVITYVFRNNGFSVFNDSDIAVDPRNMELLISFKGLSNNLSISNLTTSDTWRYNGSSIANDSIHLDGIRSLKNGQSIFKETNKQLISLAPGWNDFKITGSTNFLISFDFRFYYV